MQVQLHRETSIPVLLALLMLGFVLLMLMEAFSIKRKAIRRRIRCVYVLALLGYLAVYLYLTFFSRVPNGRHSFRLTPFYSLTHLYDDEGFHLKVFREAFLNIMLFVPFGSLVMALFHEHRHAVRITLLTGLACSVVTEVSQYALGMGLAETDDVIHNFLGVVVGMMGFYSAHAAACSLTGRE